MSAVIKLSDRALAANVDKLGAINAQIRALQAKASEIKSKLICSGLDEIEGKLFKAVIVEKSGSILFDSKKAKGFLSAAQIAACEKRGAASVSVSLYDL